MVKNKKVPRNVLRNLQQIVWGRVEREYTHDPQGFLSLQLRLPTYFNLNDDGKRATALGLEALSDDREFKTTIGKVVEIMFSQYRDAFKGGIEQVFDERTPSLLTDSLTNSRDSLLMYTALCHIAWDNDELVGKVVDADRATGFIPSTGTLLLHYRNLLSEYRQLESGVMNEVAPNARNLSTIFEEAESNREATKSFSKNPDAVIRNIAEWLIHYSYFISQSVIRKLYGMVEYFKWSPEKPKDSYLLDMENLRVRIAKAKEYKRFFEVEPILSEFYTAKTPIGQMIRSPKA